MKIMRNFVLLAALLLLAGSGWLGWRVYGMLPALEGERVLAPLEAPVRVGFDEFAIPDIEARNRADALRALGFVTAQQRLFQMDLMRRKSSGRLAEIFGNKALELDIQQRSLQMERAAGAIVEALPPAQREALQAYAEGVNAAIAQTDPGSLEFWLLGYRPEPWTPRDSLLVALSMFQSLNWRVEGERAVTIMNAALPDPVTEFLTPDVDTYATVLLGGDKSWRPKQPIPVEALASLRHSEGLAMGPAWVRIDEATIGSNHWAVNASKTADGRAMLASDMHLRLGVPNTWFRARLRYGTVDLSGVTLPGLPVFAAGRNQHLAWGFTNALADVIDLVQLELKPGEADYYRTPEGWRRFEQTAETIRVKNGTDVELPLKSTLWGPVAATPLLGQPVAVSWTALKADAVDLGLLDMDRAATLEQALDLLNRTGLPPMNVALADDQGHIAWTLTGRLPLRRGFDGSASLSWADGTRGWEGYIPPEQLPRLIDPPEGFFVTANNRTVGADYPYVLGHDFEIGYRAFRVSERLRAASQLTEQDLLAIQLDTRTAFYDFYRDLALAVIDDSASQTEPLLAEVRDALRAWDGRAESESLGFGLLEAFRENLAERVFAPFLAACREKDPNFVYHWLEMDTPLRQLLSARVPATLPEPEYPDWDGFIRAVLVDSARSLKKETGGTPLEALRWGQLNQVAIAHPFSRAQPLLSALLDMPRQGLSGCSYCVRVVSPRYGATDRLVLSPTHPEDGILHMPGGQSGHPFSAHYRDQHPYWVEGKPLRFEPGEARQMLRLLPLSG